MASTTLLNEETVKKYCLYLNDIKKRCGVIGAVFSMNDLCELHGVSKRTPNPLQSHGIIAKSFENGRTCRWKWVSNTEPNLVMAKQILIETNKLANASTINSRQNGTVTKKRKHSPSVTETLIGELDVKNNKYVAANDDVMKTYLKEFEQTNQVKEKKSPSPITTLFKLNKELTDRLELAENHIREITRTKATSKAEFIKFLDSTYKKKRPSIFKRILSLIPKFKVIRTNLI